MVEATVSDQRHLVVTFRAAPGQGDQVKDLLEQFVGPARQEAGSLYYDLYQNLDDPLTFYILDGWRDATAAAAHSEHPNVQRILPLLLPLLASPPSIETNTKLL